jgi:hypothetical protein
MKSSPLFFTLSASDKLQEQSAETESAAVLKSPRSLPAREGFRSFLLLGFFS